MLTKNTLRAVAALGFAVALGTAVSAHAQAVNLFIKNGDTQPVKVTLSNDNNNCYESNQTALGQIWEIPPAGQIQMHFWRKGGHGCDGHQGEFELWFDPHPGASERTHFDYDSHGGLEVSSGYANTYPGTLVPHGGWTDRNYTYTTVQLTPPITAGKAIGHWLLICDTICDQQHSHTTETSKTTTKTFTKEETNAITASLESKMAFEGIGSLKGTISTTSSKTIGQQMSDAFQRGETFTDVYNYVFSPEQMRDLNIFAIWQWVADVHLSDGSVDTVRSNHFTCTPDGNPPQYLPGAPENVKACRGGR